MIVLKRRILRNEFHSEFFSPTISSTKQYSLSSRYSSLSQKLQEALARTQSLLGRADRKLKHAATKDDLKKVVNVMQTMANSITILDRKLNILLEKAGGELDAAEVEEVSQHTGLSQEFAAWLNAEEEAEYLPNDGKCSRSLFFLD